MSQDKQPSTMTPASSRNLLKKPQAQATAGSSKQHDSSRLQNAKADQPTATTQTKLVANLHSAANEGKVELVRLLLRCGAHVNAQDEEFGNTALHQAAWNGFSQTVQVLCKYRANTSIRNKAQFTPLHMACQQGHNQTVRLLLMANAKTEAKNSYGDTPLHTAARYGHAGAARILLSAKCGPNQVNKNHDTPLHIAAAMGRRKLTKIFMQNGAEPAIKNKEIIANPPPAKASRSSRAAEDHAHHHLDQRYRALYAASRGQRVRGVPQQPHQDRHLQQHLQSSEDNCSSGARLGLQLSRLRLRSGELAVGVPDEEQACRSRGPEVFASAHSLGPAGIQQQARRRHQRTKTLCGGAKAELRLITGASAVDLMGARSTASVGEAGDCCPPDARDNPNEWADIMAKSGRFRASGEQSPAAASPVIELEEEEMSSGRQRRDTKSASPGAGSLRSSLSKSRGRLVLRRNRKQSRSSGLLVRRSNLGTCVGKLSLLRMRTMVSSNKHHRLSEGQSAFNGADEVDGLEKDNKVSDSRQREPGNRQRSTGATTTTAENRPVNSGRRQERLERLEEQKASTAMRAPNGSKLQATRPLAPLNDETQLYAIPKKPKTKQVAVGSDERSTRDSEVNRPTAGTTEGHHQQDNEGSSRQQQESGLVRVPSGGPALTSDGCHSSSSGSNGSSSSFTRASPPSSSSAIASSSDECIESMDLVCVKGKRLDTAASGSAATANIAQLSQQQQERPPTVVGVHMEALDLFAPGYSVIREVPQQQQQQLSRGGDNNLTGEPSLCEDDEKGHNRHQHLDNQPELAPSKAPIKQQYAAKPSNRLRQLLHLEPRAKNSSTATGSILNKGAPQQEASVNQAKAGSGENPMASDIKNVNGGHHQPPSAGQKRAEQVAANGGTAKSQAPKKSSWLMSRFSLSSSNIANHQSEQLGSGKDLLAKDKLNGKMGLQQVATSAASRDVGDAARTSSGPPQELISAVVANGQHQTDRTEEASADTNELDEGLIKPKSSTGSGRHSELIAAQKSLAAAAAAKVRRDRLFKMSGCDTHKHQIEMAASHQLSTNQRLTSRDAADNGIPLTVKTSDPFWGPLHHHHLSHQPLVLANGSGQKFILGQPMSGVHHHRSGTNSVGMSDSSPSNNGAESDNSIQTTTGSVTTDTTSGGQPAAATTAPPGDQQSSCPLGILSRILLNSKSAGAIRQVANTTNGGDPMDSSGSTLRNGQNGGSLSSSALSSPASNEQKSPAPKDHQTTSTGPKLDQLGSRSRCPIVMARSNELVDNHPASSGALEQHTPDHQEPQAPRLPAKSALKQPATFTRQLLTTSASNQAKSQPPMEPMNGLPRVASYTQISTMDGHNIQRAHPFNAMTHSSSNQLPRQQSLCNYHAMNRNHLIQTQYSPYLPYALGRYSIHGHCEPQVAGKYCGPLLQHHHMSHHDLRAQSLDSNAIDLNLPGSAINYEYFLEAPPAAHQQQAVYDGAYRQSHLNPATRYQSYANDNSLYLSMGSGGSFARDDSIYIPYLNGGGIQHDPTSTVARPATAMAAAMTGKATNDLITNEKYSVMPQQVFDRFDQAANYRPQQQRPKSSLDTFLLSGANSAPPLPMANNVAGQRRQAAANGIIADAADHNAASSGQHHPLVDQNPLIFPLAKAASVHSGQPSTLDYSPNQSSNLNHHLNHQKLAAHYPYSSSYNPNQQSGGGYVYSENSMYASDQSAANTAAFQHSDLTVLPTNETPATIITTDNSSTSSPYRQSPSVKLLTEGGSPKHGIQNLNPGNEGGNNRHDHHFINETSSVRINSSSSSPSPSPTPKASIRQQQEKNSWAPPSTPFKSLVQLNRPSLKSNQSSLTKEVARSSSPSVATIQSKNLSDNHKSAKDNNRAHSDKSNSICSPSRITISMKAQSQTTRHQISNEDCLSTVDEASSPTEMDDCNGSTVL